MNFDEKGENMGQYSGNYVGVVENPLMDGKINWDLLKTEEFPRKCVKSLGGCGIVYPSDHDESPKRGENICQPCLRRKNENKP